MDFYFDDTFGMGERHLGEQFNVTDLEPKSITSESKSVTADSESDPYDFKNLTELLEKEFRPRTQIVQKMKAHGLSDLVKKILRENLYSLSNISTLYELVGNDPNSQAAQLICQIVTEALKKENLWRDEAKELSLTQAFPRSYKKAFKPNEGDHRDTTEDEIDPLHVIDHQELLSRPKELFFQSELKIHEALQNKTNELMRPSPKSLAESIARQISDNHKNIDYLSIEVIRAAYIYSRGMTDEHFEDAMNQGMEHIFPGYSLETYESDLVQFKKELKRFKAEYFLDHPLILRLCKSAGTDPKTIWSRLNESLDSMTAKQRHALEKVFMSDEPKTFDEAADDFGITIESFKDRLDGAIKKIEAAFPEFLLIERNEIPTSHLKGDLSLNGLWRKSSALKVYPLYRIDPLTKEKVQIEIPVSKKQRNQKKREYIKAWAIDKTYVPKILDTDYFGGIRPDF